MRKPFRMRMRISPKLLAKALFKFGNSILGKMFFRSIRKQDIGFKQMVACAAIDERVSATRVIAYHTAYLAAVAR